MCLTIEQLMNEVELIYTNVVRSVSDTTVPEVPHNNNNMDIDTNDVDTTTTSTSIAAAAAGKKLQQEKEESEAEEKEKAEAEAEAKAEAEAEALIMVHLREDHEEYVRSAKDAQAQNLISSLAVTVKSDRLDSNPPMGRELVARCVRALVVKPLMIFDSVDSVDSVDYVDLGAILLST